MYYYFPQKNIGFLSLFFPFERSINVLLSKVLNDCWFCAVLVSALRLFRCVFSLRKYFCKLLLVFLIGGSQLHARELWSTKPNSFGKTPKLIIQKKSNRAGISRRLSVCAEYKYIIFWTTVYVTSIFISVYCINCL